MANLDWDVEAAVQHLQTNALSTSAGKCAKYTRQAIEAGGVQLTRHVSAKDYGSSVLAVGFVELTYTPANGYTKGDVAVIDGFQGHPHGHMEMYDGSQWISDFKQNDFWPGSAYRNTRPSYKVYRHRTQMAQPPAQSSVLGWTSTPSTPPSIASRKSGSPPDGEHRRAGGQEEIAEVRQVPGYLLWLGHAGDARDLRGVISAGIRAVVDLALNESPVAVTRELVYCRFPLLDGCGNPPWLVRAAVGAVAELVRSDVPTLVCCSADMSRTPVVVAGAVAQLRGCGLTEALAVVVGAGPADVAPGLLAEVQAALA